LGLVDGGAIVAARETTGSFGANILLGAAPVTFTAASQLWMIASTSPLATMSQGDSQGDRIALLGHPTWAAVDPSADLKPTIVMNTTLITVADQPSDVLFIGDYSNPITLVPEPSHFALGLGVLGLGLVLWRRRR
jgi:hypothetical protein